MQLHSHIYLQILQPPCSKWTVKDQDGEDGGLTSVTQVRSLGTLQLTVMLVIVAVFSALKQLRITVLDVNDHAPVFVEDVFSISVSEGEDVDQTILEVLAYDEDSGINGEIEYSLEDDFGIFEIIEGTGELQLFNTLDRENQDKYVCLVASTVIWN